MFVAEVDNVNTTGIITPANLRLNSSSNAPVAAEGSQCSSSCSTIVVVNAPGALGTQRPRCSSATSSLELGYSHTAQNSAVSSEVAGFPGVIYDRCKKPGKYAGNCDGKHPCVIYYEFLGSRCCRNMNQNYCFIFNCGWLFSFNGFKR